MTSAAVSGGPSVSLPSVWPFLLMCGRTPVVVAAPAAGVAGTETTGGKSRDDGTEESSVHVSASGIEEVPEGSGASTSSGGSS